MGKNSQDDVKIKGFLIDLVGTLVKSKYMDPFSGVVEVFNEFQQEYPVAIITNNSTQTTEELKSKLSFNGFQIDNIPIISPFTVLEEILNQYKSEEIFVIGEEVVKQRIEKMGYRLGEGRIVIVGLDRHLTYETLKKATNLLLNGGKLFGFHNNKLYLVREGEVGPSVGAILAFLEYATGVKAEIFGKPDRYFYLTALKYLNLPIQDVAIVGDDPFTEIKAPAEYGFKTIFLTCGKYKKLPKDITADYVFPDFTGMKKFLG